MFSDWLGQPFRKEQCHPYFAFGCDYCSSGAILCLNHTLIGGVKVFLLYSFLRRRLGAFAIPNRVGPECGRFGHGRRLGHKFRKPSITIENCGYFSNSIEMFNTI
jgi:hypothetical protein